MKANEAQETYPIQFRDKLDEYLWKEHHIFGGSCSSIESMKYAVAREVAEKLTDAFIEKACEYLNKSCRRFILTEKDIEDFVNYMQEEPTEVKPKECMYSKDNYTDEDRQVLCDGCEEDCKYNKKEPVSEDLEEAIDTYLATYFGGEKEKQDWPFLKKMAIHFAKWQKQQTISKACEWLNKNFTFIHPRKGVPVCAVNLNSFKDALNDEEV